VHDGGHALHADRAVEHARLAALASVRALLPPQPSSGRCTMATPPLKTACGTEPRQRRAPHPRGTSSRHAASPCRVERPERRAAAGSSAAAKGPRLHERANGRQPDPDRAFALYRALFGIDELTQEKGTIRELRLLYPKKYVEPGASWRDHRADRDKTLLRKRHSMHIDCLYNTPSST